MREALLASNPVNVHALTQKVKGASGTETQFRQVFKIRRSASPASADRTQEGMFDGCFVHLKATKLLTNVSAYSHPKLPRYDPRSCQTTQITADQNQQAAPLIRL